MKQAILTWVGALLLVGCANDAAEQPPQDANAQLAGDVAAINGE